MPFSRLPSLSSSSRQSVYRLASGHFSAAAPKPELDFFRPRPPPVSTSQNAITFAAPSFDVSVMSPQPLPPTPTPAMAGVLLGAAFKSPDGRMVTLAIA